MIDREFDQVALDLFELAQMAFAVEHRYWRGHLIRGAHRGGEGSARFGDVMIVGGDRRVGESW
jgi:hypothetical protein